LDGFNYVDCVFFEYKSRNTCVGFDFHDSDGQYCNSLQGNHAIFLVLQVSGICRFYYAPFLDDSHGTLHGMWVSFCFE